MSNFTPIVKKDSEEKRLQLSKSKSLALCSTQEARALIDFKEAIKLKALPLSVSSSRGSRIIRFAVSEESPADIQKQLSFTTGCNAEVSQVDRQILIAAIERAYKADDCLLGNNIQLLKDLNVEKQIEEDLSEEETVPKALRVILEYAIAREASDIHLIPAVDGLLLKLRIKGELFSYKEPVCSLPVAGRLMARIKVLSGLRSDIKSMPQDGSFSIRLASGSRQIRISSMPTIHGEKCVMRVTSRAMEFRLQDLGFSDSTESIIKSVLSSGSGLVLVCGATGSGKTTTLYALTQHLVSLNMNVVSIEDPVESHIDGVSQTSLNLQKGLDYHTALKSILRQDPDAILVGEIRDLKSAELVLSAALSGHIVLSSIHAGSIQECILRMEDLGCSAMTLSSALRLVISQSLVQKLCDKCKVLDLNLSNRHSLRIFRSVGCAECDYSGFNGRLLVPERAYFGNLNTFDLFKKGDPETFNNALIYETKNAYLENYLRQGLILPV